MLKRAQRVQAIRGFGIDRVASQAESSPHRAEWRVLRMENLDTNLPLPPEAIAITRDSLETAAANSWLPFTGDLALRQAVSDFTHARSGHRYDPEREIVITCGGLEGILDALLALIDPGDEVILTDPTYAGLVNRVHLAGGIPLFAPFRVNRHGEWEIDLDRLASVVSNRTVLMLLMSPSMPSGGWFDEEAWRVISVLCLDRDIALLYDAAMEGILFDDRPLIHPLKFEGMADRTVVVGSLSKEHRMIGWRVGWVCGPPQVVEDAGWVHVYNTTTPTGIARAAATAVLRGDQGHVQACVSELQRRRDAIFEALPGWPLVRPAGGWSLLLDVASLGLDPFHASRLLLEESAVAATAMPGWGGDVAERFIRFVYSAETVDDLRSLAGRVEGTQLAAAVESRPKSA